MHVPRSEKSNDYYFSILLKHNNLIYGTVHQNRMKKALK
jgi:hypothetical protein